MDENITNNANEATAENTNIEEAKNDYLVEFNKTYVFEGTEYNNVDLSGIENLKTRDLAEADRLFFSTGQVALMNEMSTGYICIVASLATKKPVAFFEQLPAKEGIKLKAAVSGFFYN